MTSTHAGGIQPSSSFFHPGRPAQQPRYSPQPSIAELHDDDPGVYPLSHLPTSRHSLHHIATEDPVTDVTDDPPSHPFSAIKRIKQSREPLLPIGGASFTRRPSVSTNNPSTQSNVIPPSSPKRTATNRVRTSLDRVFALSFSHNRSGSYTYTDTNRLPDEERDHNPVSVQSHSRSHSFNKQVLSPDSPLHSLNSPHYHAESSHSHLPSLQSQAASSPSPTPPPSFIATPPTLLLEKPYPLSRAPIFKPGSSVPLKKYHFHPSRNRFFLGGRLLTGGDSPWAFIASFSLAVSISVLWCSTTSVFWWHHGKGAQAIVVIGAYLAALVLSTMLTTATTDPGILPRNLDPNPPYPASSPSDGGVRAPMPRDLRVRTETVRVKYCATCMTYRPPRSSHCKMCDNCVDGCDHHCQWVNNCVGRRNYTSFFALISFSTIALILIIVTSALHLYIITTQGKNLRSALNDRKGIGSAVVFSLSIVVLWPVAALFAYHLRLLVLNTTTIEQIRNQAHKSLNPGVEKLANPFTHGTRRRNFATVLCRSRGFSWLDAKAVATEDQRAVNPGVRRVDTDEDGE